MLAYIVFPNVRGRFSEHGQRDDLSAFSMRSLPIYVLAALVRRCGWDVVTVDETCQAVPEGRPDLVMITVWTSTAPSAYALADSYRAQGVPVVVGGVHASLMPGEALRHADAVVAGEAEAVMPTVLADVAAGSLKPIYEGEWLDMDATPSISEYADLYSSGPNRWSPIHGIQTSRGCRYNCSYCSVIRINGRGMRHMDPERAVEELRIISRLPLQIPGGTAVYIHDDDLMSDPDYTKLLYEAIIRSKLKLRIGCQASIGIARDSELLALAARAGTTSICVGLESMSRESLIEANKKNRPHEFKELIARVHEHGIGLTTGVIFGFDHDEPDIFEQTGRFLEDIEVDNVHFTALTPLPGTETFAHFWEQDRIIDLDWSRYDALSVVIQPERMTPEQLHEGLWESYRAFNARGARNRRFRRMMRTHPWSISGAFLLGSISYTRRHHVMSHRPRLGFVPDPEDLEKLLRSSRAPASEAINVAVQQASTLLPAPRRRSAPEIAPLAHS